VKSKTLLASLRFLSVLLLFIAGAATAAAAPKRANIPWLTN
jgi:hypothetical protein